MKKKIVGILVCTLLIATTLPATETLNKEDMNKTLQGLDDIEWEYTYGYDEFDWLYCIDIASNGGYIATGISEENDIYYAWLLKIDENGVEEWSKRNYEFNGTSPDNDIIVPCVRDTPDGGYLVGGFGRYYNKLYGIWTISGYLWKTDSEGATEWLKPLTNEEETSTYVPFVFETYDNVSWIFAGFYGKGTFSNLDIGFFKTDLDGNLIWNESYDLGLNFEFARSIDKTTDGGYFLSGGSLENPSSNNGGYCMIKTDDEGNKEWDVLFDEPGWDYGSAMGCHQTADGGYIMSGISDSFGEDGTDLWIIKTDENGDMQWDKTYGGPNDERNYGMCATEDGGYAFVLIKDVSVISGTKEDLWIINTDKQGNYEWELLYEKEGTQWIQSIHQIDDEGFIVSGRSGVFESPDSDGLIMKIAPFPHFEIDIAGGLGVKITITNDGKGDAVQVPYEISVTGGILGLIDKTFNGTIDIEAGASKSISSGLLFGLGGIDITVKVGVKEETFEGKQFLIFTRI